MVTRPLEGPPTLRAPQPVACAACVTDAPLGRTGSCTLTATTAAPAARVILAIDLGKYKSGAGARRRGGLRPEGVGTLGAL